MPKAPLTARQAELVNWIRTFTFDRGYQPSHQDTADRFDMTRAAVACHLSAARKKGWVGGPPGAARALTFAEGPPWRQRIEQLEQQIAELRADNERRQHARAHGLNVAIGVVAG